MTETLNNLYERGVIERVDFIKADIKGYEKRMLCGGEKMIRKFKPKLVICYYQFAIITLETLIRIIRGFSKNYKLAINDKVLFAWNEDR
ncbi:FkbM family methyltransferase [Fervidobacterium thailandense]|uniref:Methyltransferase FkbM domain-containing protein n=1 Tax=Fervidobacterium thailandense TaxID=1008305 RepID=A0A1E3G3I4_9BACT|nr:FkbM family methyltransferase [Fervidobacterium thailandense]ODN30248.1 hypothetical protein A4H02_06740 [Fervidobacterium thailandense]